MNKIITPNEHGSVDDRVINNFESQIGYKLPRDYYDFLLKNNGGEPELSVFDFIENGESTSSRLHLFYGIYEEYSISDIRKKIKTFEQSIPSEFLPIACDLLGNQLCLSIVRKNYGSIYFWDHEEEPGFTFFSKPNNMHFVANSFTTFFSNLYEDRSEEVEDEITNICKKGDIDSLNNLLEQGYSINAKSEDDLTLAQLAAAYGQLSFLETIKTMGAAMSGAIFYAIHNDHIDIVKYLIKNGIDVNVRNENAFTPLMIATIGGNVEIVKFLIENGADENAENNAGQTAKLFLIGKGNKELEDLLGKA